MSGKRYFKVEYDEEWYLFDSDTISEELVTEQAEYGYGVFANSLSPSEICERLNEQQARIKELEEENEQLKIANAKWLDKSLQDKQIRYDNSDHDELVRRYLQLKEEIKNE